MLSMGAGAWEGSWETLPFSTGMMLQQLAHLCMKLCISKFVIVVSLLQLFCVSAHMLLNFAPLDIVFLPKPHNVASFFNNIDPDGTFEHNQK